MGNYRKEAAKCVLEALQIAYMQKQEPVSIAEVRTIGLAFSSLPETKFQRFDEPLSGSWSWAKGGYTPFTFPDRTQRWLNSLVRNGQARVERRGRNIYYEPLVELDPNRLGSLQIDMLTKGPYRTESFRYLDKYFRSIGPHVVEELDSLIEEAEEKRIRDEGLRRLLEE